MEQFSGPSGIAVDSTDGTIYVVDSWNHRIQVFDSDGNFQMTFGSDVIISDVPAFEETISPVDVAVSATGTQVYVVDSRGSNILGI